MFRRFTQTPLVPVCAGFSALVLALCVAGGLHYKNRVEHDAYRDTENIAQILIASFDDNAITTDGILRRLATEIPASVVAATHEAELRRLLSQYALQPSMMGPAVLDRDGTLIASATIDAVPKLSLKDRNVFRAHAEHGDSDLYISTPTQSLITSEWAIQFSRALRDASGAFYGVVVVSYRLQHFIGLYEKLKLSDRGLAALIGKDGIVRVRTLNSAIGYGTAVSRIPLVFNRVVAGETSGRFHGRAGTDDVTRIGTFIASPTTPFYVTVGYGEDFLRSRYLGFFVTLGVCWLVLTAAMIAGAALIHRLDKLSEQAQLEVVSSAAAERRKISADMHDSIGASLAALLAHFTTDNVNVGDVRRRLGEILMELRFLVDSSESDDGDFNLVLGNVRHRMAASIELAGIAFSWQVEELPAVRGLGARDALAIKLILMEALTNVLHHASATTASLTARYDAERSVIVVTVADDGCGFDPAAASGGRGLANMRKRTASISTGATMVIESAEGRGTIVRLEVKVPTV